MKPAMRRRSITWAPILLLAVAALASLIPLSAAGFSLTLGQPAASPAPAAVTAAVAPTAAPTATAVPTGLPNGAAGLPWEYLVDEGEGDFLLPGTTATRSPSVATEAWISDSVAVRVEPSPTAPVEFVLGRGFPVTVTADQDTGTGWLLIDPRTAVAHLGYVPVAAVTYEPPAGGTAASASMDALSPELADYLAGWGSQVGVTVTDLRTGTAYSYNGDHGFVTASSVKVALLFALLRQLEAAGQSPSDEQIQLLTAMIEWSDNDAAQAIDVMIGDRGGLQAFADELGLDGFRPGSTYDEGWGWGTLTPDAMARMLTLFERGELLASASNNALARELLSSVDADQRTGVGTTAPEGAFVMLKNGWVPGPDDLWVFNSSGIVELPGHAYVISAYTAHNASLEQGQAIVTHACAAIAAILG